MNKDVDLAIKRRDGAERDLSRVNLPPKENGATVTWVHNALVWRRVGEDDWLPIGDQRLHMAFPSYHIASMDWEANK